jgi:hypothetical protein
MIASLLKSAAMDGRPCDLRNQGRLHALSKSAAMDGRFLILAIRDDRKPVEKCGHGWPPL